MKDTAMWSDSRLRSIELSDKAKYFDRAGYPDTAKWIRHLADQVKIKKPTTDLEKDLDEMINTWKSDYVKGNAARQTLFEAVWPRAFKAVKSKDFGAELLKLDPIIRDLRDNAQNFTPLSQAFLPFKGDRKMQFYGICFHYLLNVEGIFDDAIKVLYGLVLISEGQLVPENLGDLSTWNIREEFKKLGVPDLVFDGWRNGHVRNSVSHSRFRYNDKPGEMRFIDINNRTRKITFDESFTLEQFSDLYFKLDDVWHILQNFLFMLRIIQLVLAPWVPDPGKDLMFPS